MTTTKNETKYVIRRQATGSTNGVALTGDVYVQRLEDVIPGYPSDIGACSSTKLLSEASRWTYEDGGERIRQAHWIGAALVLAGTASPELP